ncbi:MAG: GAF domain-containing protein, partial [Rhodospirillaceae bacterium]|nr:GAF domain-containing protein [Rhodospirillaceae bacterium]
MSFIFIKQLKLSTRIIIALSTIVSAIFVVQTAYNLHHNNEERLNSLNLRATLLAASQADALAGLIWDYDQKRARGNLIGITQDPEVIDAEIIDDTGQVFANFSMLKLSDARRKKIKKQDAKSIIKVKQKIVFITEEGKKRNLGHITIFMTTDRITSAFWNDLISSAFIAFIILTIIIIGLSLTIRSFTKPIMMMSSIMRQRLIGDYSGDVDDQYMEREDEIGDIAKSIEADQKNRRDELKLLETTRAIATELNLDNLLAQIIRASTELLNAERSTLYLFDAENDTLWTRVAEGIGDHVIRLKSNEGIAGSVFQTGKAEIVLDPSSDDRWEQQISEDLGFNVKNILSMPITNKSGQKLGVTQVLNKKNGAFSDHDIERMASLNAQTSAAIENAQLFESVLKMRNYNESILGSLTNGVISLDRDFKIQKINTAAQEIMGLSQISGVEKTFEEIIGNKNIWITELLTNVVSSGKAKQIMDNVLKLSSGGKIEVNLVITPLQSIEDSDGGYLIIFEDISEEKRVRGAMSRYV